MKTKPHLINDLTVSTIYRYSLT